MRVTGQEPEIDLTPEPEAGEAVDYQAAGLSEDFAVLVRNRAKIQAAKAQVEAAEATNKEALNTFLAKRPVGFSTLVGQYRATKAKGKETKKLDPLLLLKAGVSTKIIAAATVENTGNPYVVVTDTLKVREKRAA